jgi:hypothetical protein
VGQGASVPDLSGSETKLWFHFLARSNIDAGCEAIHYGQAELMNRNDPKPDHWAEVLALARCYAVKNAPACCVVRSYVRRGALVREDILIDKLPSQPKPVRKKSGVRVPRQLVKFGVWKQNHWRSG